MDKAIGQPYIQQGGLEFAPEEDHMWNVFQEIEYARSSVLAGEIGRRWYASFSDLDEAKKAYPNADVRGGDVEIALNRAFREVEAYDDDDGLGDMEDYEMQCLRREQESGEY